MNEVANIDEIGSKVKVCLNKVKDRLPDDLFKKLSKNPYGTIVDYKMTDGAGVGLVISLNDGSKNWFFINEIEVSDYESKTLTLEIKNDSSIKDFTNIILGSNKRSRPNGNAKIGYLINPINFISWIIYAIKDI